MIPKRSCLTTVDANRPVYTSAHIRRFESGVGFWEMGSKRSGVLNDADVFLLYILY